MEIPTFDSEERIFRKNHPFLIGCDEVGRGCLAGPVVAAAVLLRWDEEALRAREDWRSFVRDSKQLSRQQRQKADQFLREHVLAFGIGEVATDVIDDINILQASLRAMQIAIQALGAPSDAHVFVDGTYKVPGILLDQETVIGGDAKVFSIAAASIIAKEYRDQLMERLHEQYPNYGFAAHKGYGTPVHRQAIREHGLSPVHRVTFCRNLTSTNVEARGV